MVTRGIPVRLHRVISSQDDCSCIFHFHFFYVTNVAIHIPVLALVWFTFGRLDALPGHPGEAHEPAATLRNTLKNRTLWTLAFFLMFYIGFV